MGRLCNGSAFIYSNNFRLHINQRLLEIKCINLYMNTPREPLPTSKDKMDGTQSSPSAKAIGGWRFYDFNKKE